MTTKKKNSKETKNNSRNGKKDFSEMSKEERKEYLSMDFIMRMVRTEQKISSSFGEKQGYKDTEYYKSLPDTTKKKFDRFINKKSNAGKVFKKASLVLGGVAIIGAGVYLFLEPSSITGSAVGVSDSEKGVLSFLGAFVVIAGVSAGVLAGAVSLSEKKKKRNFDSHEKVMDRVNFKRKVKDAFR